MTRTTLLIVGFLGAGLVGGLGGRFLFPVEPAAPAPAAPAFRAEARLDELASRVARIEEAMARDLPRLPAPEGPETAATDGSAEPPADSTPPLPAVDGSFEERVRSTVEEVFREQQEARDRKAAATQEEQEKVWLERIRKEIDLTEDQVQTFRDMLARRREALAAYKADLAALGPDPDEGRKAALDQRLADLGRDLEGMLRSVLSSAQYDALMRMRRTPQK